MTAPLSIVSRSPEFRLEGTVRRVELNGFFPGMADVEIELGKLRVTFRIPAEDAAHYRIGQTVTATLSAS